MPHCKYYTLSTKENDAFLTIKCVYLQYYQLIITLIYFYSKRTFLMTLNSFILIASVYINVSFLHYKANCLSYFIHRLKMKITSYFRPFLSKNFSKTYIQYGLNLRKSRLYDSLAGSACLLLNWSGWNMGTSNDERLLNWLDLNDE